MSQFVDELPTTFKGIALFTPGGDLVYCIDEFKQQRWHLQLCAVLQDALQLPEPPHFLVPCFTATLDRWIAPHQPQPQIIAEASPTVLKHQAVLNAVFGTPDQKWQAVRSQPEPCSPTVLQTYRQTFAPLWECHDLIIRSEQTATLRDQSANLAWNPTDVANPSTSGYVLRLFISGRNPGTERILQNLHRSLERSLHHPYTLKVVDVHKHPDLVEADHVSATPTLLKVWPPPVKRIVGNLDDVDTILRILTTA